MKKIFTILLVVLLLCGCSYKDDSNTLNVLNWSSYIPSEIISDFERETGIDVNYSTYSSNEELLAKLSSSKTGTYDLIFPSDYMVELMISRNMLEKIDKSKISNYSNIIDLFLNQPYDYNNEYSLPFLAATTVIAYNKENIKENIESYNDLLNNKYNNDIILLDDQRIVIGIALLATNNEFNETRDSKLNEAKKWLLDLKKNIKAYDSDSPKSFLITNETNIGILWNAEALIAKENNPNIEIIYPKDGHAISIDNYAIVASSKHQDNAYKFINYLLSTDVSKKITDEYPYLNVTYGAMNQNYDELERIIITGSYVNNIGENISKYDKIWAEIK